MTATHAFKRWYGFEYVRGGVKLYVGKCETTEAEIREAFAAARYTITGDLVTVWTRP